MIEELLNICESDGNRTFKVTGLTGIGVVQIEVEFWDALTHTILDRTQVQSLRGALDRWLIADTLLTQRNVPE